MLVPHPDAYVKALITGVMAFGDGPFKEVTKRDRQQGCIRTEERPLRTQQERGHLQAERPLRRELTCWHLDLGCPVSRTVGK